VRVKWWSWVAKGEDQYARLQLVVLRERPLKVPIGIYAQAPPLSVNIEFKSDGFEYL